MTDAPRAENVRFASRSGAVLATIGVVAGIVMIAKRRLVSCTDGFSIPSPDGQCYSHPQLALGVGVVVISLLLAILVFLVSQVAQATITSEREDA